MLNNLALLALSGACVMLGGCEQMDRETETIQVTRSERACKSSGAGAQKATVCQYLVYTPTGTYRNTDDALNLKFNSSDIQGRLEWGKSYKVQTVGWRIGFLSMYPNIIKVESEVAPGVVKPTA